MKLYFENSYEALSQRAAALLLAAMARDRRVNIAITAGNSPRETYSIVTRHINAAPDNYRNVHYYNFDEVPIAGESKGYTLRELDQLYFQPAGIAESQIHPLTCENYTTQDQAIDDAGGLDFMLIGLGADGHFCGNMPYAVKFEEKIYRIPITREYSWYSSLTALCGNDPVPEWFVTMGAASLMKVRQLVMIVNGLNKAETVKHFFESPVDTAFPASILKLHPNFTVICDKEAVSRLSS
ncbi:conserved hypothetical protein [Treponema primitia ZAS-2]|uniref:Glucosamine/galactosamine-6-phosphate isomerase domain-containing protein n=1 Tax=Treponema primitia (strain ATCC BAA-887 / DSM 12427 / ZAS-2) TaxID=545694 RepID=F5YLG6_TREPZ|nr:glucosamine-6-phosphate deaminase [Treponema primitia]AEF84486.1 conserved hypothetical protein [Treponema primitia ZAS-2]